MADATNNTNPSVLPLGQRVEDAFAGIAACIDSVQSALMNYQQPQDIHFHLALKACRDGRAAVREINRMRIALSRIRDAAHWQSNGGEPSDHCDVLEKIEREARAALADGDA